MAEHIPDEEIMQNIKKGNLTDMSVLFERYNVRLFNFFLKMGLNREVSQDLTQNLFYRMIKYRNSYRSGNSVKSWMYQIARNLHADHCRMQKKTDDLYMLTDNYRVDVTDDPDNYPEDDYKRLEKALALLSDVQREIIVLSRYQGLKYSEISVIVNQSVPAVKVAVYRAIQHLRKIFIKQI
ncbi:MAG: RNA polymerase sigma factor [Bacteroidales bacterium]